MSQRERIIVRNMFEEFDNKGSREGRGRRGVSALLSVGIFAAIALLVGGAVTAHQVRKHRMEREQQIEFANLHALRAPKPKALVKPAARKRSHVAQQKVVALKSIPNERPDEADGELAEAEDTGAVDGIIEEKVKGPGGGSVATPPPPAPRKPEPVVAAPEQEREEILAPRFVSGCRAPEVPSALLSNAATIRIDVTMLVDSAGRVTSAKVLNPNPLIPDQSIIECAMAQVYEPAHLPDGTKVPYPVRRRFVFKPAQA
ncbi:MAG: hypothetical protein JXP73_00010 [Deltaproteobacteria bacterium]|nr:hypothetical protein [Deltaproteobacteria bacterium]